jgi:amino acid adenylation domain-containing protein
MTIQDDPVNRAQITLTASLPEPADAPPARPIHDLIAAQADRSPDAIAVSQGDETLRYRQLDERAEALARHLRSCGVRSGAVVAVLQHRSPALVVTLLAILKAGAAYLALDPQDPPSYQMRSVKSAGAVLVITERFAARELSAEVRVLRLDDTTSVQPAPPPAGPITTAPHSTPDSLAYVSFTSGTTGEPRGVGVPHRAISRLVQRPDWIDILPNDVFILLAPVAFDASTWEIWTPLVHGCRLAIAPADSLDIGRLAATLKHEKVSVLWLTAGLFHQLVTARPDSFSGLRHLVAGGDVIVPDHLSRVLAAHPGLTFTNGYGPTENTTFTTCWTTRTAPVTGSVPIGRPIAGTRIAVLDESLRPVLPGDRGQLYAAGDGLARGYVNSARATAERFIPATFTTEPGARMYRTGDLVRWSADATLEFLGRIDDQFKVQGFRVEPSSVAVEIARLPEVRDAVVLAQSDGVGGKRLLSYVVLTDPATVDGTDLCGQLRLKLRSRLPAYAIPWAVIVTEELPLNHNGKVDRRALPAASRMPRNVCNEFVEPRTTTQRRLAALWGDVLGVEPVGIEDDFFDLGGHSLLVAELLGTLKDRFGKDVPARILYLQPTISELAAELEKQESDPQAKVTVS